MSEILFRTFLHQWPRKLTALLAAIIIWFLVDHSITITRTIPNIPVRVLNVPENKTIDGLLPNGLIGKRLTLTITGQKTALEELSSSDLEVVTDAAGKGDRWTLEVTKKNLVSLNPDLDLTHGIASVSPVELTIQMSSYVTEKIPITITRPVGEPPKGYTYLDVWPQRLFQTVSGPDRSVQELKAKGLRLTFDLSKISKEELDALSEKTQYRPEDEVRFFIPDAWKKVILPFGREPLVAINDPESDYLHLDLLKQEFLSLNDPIPVTLFFPLSNSDLLNPETYHLDIDSLIKKKNGLYVLGLPLYVKDVSRLFLDTVRDRIELTVTVLPPSVSKELPWSIEFIDPLELENAYIKAALAAIPQEERAQLPPKLHEDYLRLRFRTYMHEFKLYKEDETSLDLIVELGQGLISIREAP